MSFRSRTLERREIPNTETTKMNEWRLDNINSFRKTKGMPRVKPNKRPCLKCDHDFLSAGPQNRLCTSCIEISGGYVEPQGALHL